MVKELIKYVKMHFLMGTAKHQMSPQSQNQFQGIKHTHCAKTTSCQSTAFIFVVNNFLKIKAACLNYMIRF